MGTAVRPAKTSETWRGSRTTGTDSRMRSTWPPPFSRRTRPPGRRYTVLAHCHCWQHAAASGLGVTFVSESCNEKTQSIQRSISVADMVTFARMGIHTHLGVPPAVLRFYTVACCTPHHPRPSGRVRSKRRERSSAELGVLHAILTPRIGTRFMACNLPARLETRRAFHVARHDNAP
jgi:hypothetical protein